MRWRARGDQRMGSGIGRERERERKRTRMERRLERDDMTYAARAGAWTRSKELRPTPRSVFESANRSTRRSATRLVPVRPSRCLLCNVQR